MVENFLAENLSVLVKDAASIASLCKELEINRQQFNKYLSGEHAPSRRNLAKIARHFSMPEKDLFLRPDQFRLSYENSWRLLMDAIAAAPRFQTHAAGYLKSSAAMADFHGVYLRYQVSSIYPDTVLRCPLLIYGNGPMSFSYFMERFKNPSDKSRTSFIMKYHGICNYSNGKVFLLDTEVMQKNEVYLTAVTPIFRRNQLMLGITSGIAAQAARGPFATRVALELIARGRLRLSHLRLACTLGTDDLSIPEEVRAYLGIDGGQKGTVLRGTV